MLSVQRRSLGAATVPNPAGSPRIIRHHRAAQAPVIGVSRSVKKKVSVKAAEVPGESGIHPQMNANTGGTCPFLAALRTPPVVNLPWFKRVQLEILDPAKFHTTVLQEKGSDNVINVASQPLFDQLYIPATMQLAKDVFAAEGSGTITQGLTLKGNNIAFKGFSTLLGEDSLLVVADPNRHKYLRTLLQPAFNAESIASYLPDVQALIKRHLANWGAAGAKGVKAYDSLKTLTFDFILQVAMGRALPNDELHQLSALFNDVTRGLVAWPFLDIPFTPWHKALKAQKQLLSYFQLGVTAGRAQLASGGEVPGVLGRLLTAVDEEGNRLTDQEICDNMLLLLVAGHDTSSTTLTRCMSNLKDYPGVVQKLRDEQAAVVAKHGDVITAAAMKDMPYADAVIRETLRLDPVIHQVVRIATRDFELGGYGVPAGTRLSLPLRYLAETEPRWATADGAMHPSVFNPDRMMTPSGAKPGQLMPFGGGVRYCLGAGLAMAEMKVYLATLARGYDFTLDNDTEWKPALGYYPVNGLPMVVTKHAE